ncbi:uncharacterized protein LOC114667532 [Erpetoichthys calabaricus]|uniref:uncharacterized protein LOC114667532 n=1 Tax=Erpetoichthys calabaricus TaxID=27687 RepID=UPI0010A07C41|nr:uncharacterized protein LOC114667532 [Erpetoichthys calabaricus]
MDHSAMNWRRNVLLACCLLQGFLLRNLCRTCEPPSDVTSCSVSCNGHVTQVRLVNCTSCDPGHTQTCRKMNESSQCDIRGQWRCPAGTKLNLSLTGNGSTGWCECLKPPESPYMNGLWLTLLLIPAALILVLGLVVRRVCRSRRTMKQTKEPQLEISSPNVFRANTTGRSQELQMSLESPEDDTPAGWDCEVKENGAHNGVTAGVSWTRYNSFKKEEANEEDEEEEEDENEDFIHLPLLQRGSSPALTDSLSNSEHVHQVMEEQSEVSIDPHDATCHPVIEEINNESDEDEDEYVEMRGNILLEEDNDSSDSYEAM